MIDCNKPMERKDLRKKLCTGRKVCCERRQERKKTMLGFFDTARHTRPNPPDSIHRPRIYRTLSSYRSDKEVSGMRSG